jgi:hypothetical protein
MKVGDVVKLVDSRWLGFRPELEGYPMIVTKIHTSSLGVMITVSTEHGTSRWKKDSLEVISASR